MEAVQRELERLAREELGQIEPLLTNVRKQNATDPREATRQRQRPEDATNARDNPMHQSLRDARQHQEEVEKTISDLLSRLEPWTSTQEIKGETRALLEEQRRLQKQTEDLKQGEQRPEYQAALERAQGQQQKLQERAQQVLERMDRVAQERKEHDPQTAEELKKAALQGRDANIPGLMREAQEYLQQHQLGEAGRKQAESAQQLQELVKTLEDRPEADLDRLIKKNREEEKKLAQLEEEQERLRRKQQEVQKIADAQQRQEELKRLAREQEQLRQKTEEIVKQLSRQRTERSRHALAGAVEQMNEASRQLQQGQAGDEQQEEALDRLAEAREELERARQETEEQLAREQLTKVIDEIKRLKERQEGLVAEGARIQRQLLQRRPEEWRGLLISLGRLADSQGLKEKGLAAEALTLADSKLDGAPVFARVMRRCAEIMDQAARRWLEYRDLVNTNGKPESEAGIEAGRCQREALHGLDQLLDALKEAETGLPRLARRENGEPGEDRGSAGDAIPPIAELKLLRQMQAEVNRKTEEFRQQHPDLNMLDDQARATLQDLHRRQQEIAELLEEMTQLAEPREDKP
jgi:hypothetical protein